MDGITVVLGITTLAGIGYGIMQNNRVAKLESDLTAWVNYALTLESESDGWRGYANSLAGKVDSLKIDLAVKSGKAIKVGNDTHVMPMFDNMLGTIESRDIKMDRDNPNRPIFGSGSGKVVSLNGKAKDYVPVVRSGENDPITNLPYARVEFERKAETPKESKSAAKDNGKGKSEPKADPVVADQPSEHSTRIAQIMPIVESELKRKLTTNELEWLVMKVPYWLEPGKADQGNDEYVKRCVGQFSKAK